MRPEIGTREPLAFALFSPEHEGMTTAAPPGPTRAPAGPRHAPVWAAAFAGLAAGIVTVGVGALVAVVAGASTDPLVAVGSAFVDATPTWLKDFAASTFGTADKAVLMIGEVVVLAALAALAGVLAARRWVWGAAVVVVLGLVAMAAALGRPDASWTAMVPSLAGTVAGLWTLKALVDRLPREAARGRAVGRRTARSRAIGPVRPGPTGAGSCRRRARRPRSGSSASRSGGSRVPRAAP